jgi:hypothetical protein
MIRNVLCMLLAIFVIGSCTTSDNCVSGESRCDGNDPQICNASKKWESIGNCDVIGGQSGGKWACSPPDVEAGLPAACLPVISIDDADVDVYDVADDGDQN